MEILKVITSIKGFEGLYAIGKDYGIYRLKPHKYSKDKDKYPKRIAEKFDKDGYSLVTLCNNGKAYCYRKHIIIAKEFIPNPQNKPQVNHINGVKTDNRIRNLEWVTQKENNLHALKTGLRNMKNNKLSKKVGQFDLNGKLIKKYVSANEAKRQTGYSQGHISECCRGDNLKTYKGFIWRYI